MVDHLDDLHADFLSIWGIDLDTDTSLSGPRFFSLARRTFAYSGVMAARVAAEERDEQPQVTEQGAQHRPAPVQSGERAQEVDLATFRAMHPELIEHNT